MEKSHVTLETAVCPVCGREFETGRLLLDRLLRKRFHMRTATGYDLCEEHRKQAEDGYIFLIACKNRPDAGRDAFASPGDAKRTGEFCAIRRTAAEQLFQDSDMFQTVNFCEPVVMDFLRSIAEQYMEASHGQGSGAPAPESVASGAA